MPVFVMAAALFVVGAGRPADASCLPPVAIGDAVAQADVVVVATVSSTRSRDRIATVHVVERWKGEVERTFEVFGGPDADNEATTVDRTYATGKRYLMFVQEPRAHGYTGSFGARYEDNSCSTTQEWRPGLAQYRPADATIYSAGGRAAASGHNESRAAQTGWWILAAALGAAAAGAALVIHRRSRGRAAPPT